MRFVFPQIQGARRLCVCGNLRAFLNLWERATAKGAKGAKELVVGRPSRLSGVVGQASCLPDSNNWRAD
jgi:hypothetical protein